MLEVRFESRPLWLQSSTSKPLCYADFYPDMYVLFIYFKIYFIYLFLAALGLRCCARAFLQLQRAGATLCCGAGASHCGGYFCCGARTRHVGFSSCGTQAQQLWLAGSRAQVQQLWRTGLVAPLHVGSSWTRVQTCVPCIGSGFLTTAPPGKLLYVLITST